MIAHIEIPKEFQEKYYNLISEFRNVPGKRSTTNVCFMYIY